MKKQITPEAKKNQRRNKEETEGKIFPSVNILKIIGNYLSKHPHQEQIF